MVRTPEGSDRFFTLITTHGTLQKIQRWGGWRCLDIGKSERSCFIHSPSSSQVMMKVSGGSTDEVRRVCRADDFFHSVQLAFLDCSSTIVGPAPAFVAVSHVSKKTRQFR